MPKKKPGFVREMHEGVGNTLKDINTILGALLIEISRAYPLAVAEKCRKVVDNLSALRSELDNRAYEDLKIGDVVHDSALFDIYFGDRNSKSDIMITGTFRST